MATPKELVLEVEKLVTPLNIAHQGGGTILDIGSWDFSAPVTQMASIDSAMPGLFRHRCLAGGQGPGIPRPVRQPASDVLEEPGIIVHPSKFSPGSCAFRQELHQDQIPS